MTSLASYTRTSARSFGREANFGKDHSLNYVVAFAALGMFVSLIALALGDASIGAAW
jgi:RsiW-degrading membrane proteinase PrsW (M82 family)